MDPVRAARRRAAERRLPGGLRHHARRGADPGCGRVDQHAAAAVGGVRHERHEGSGQRRPQPVGARRLVGGGGRSRGRVGPRRCRRQRRGAPLVRDARARGRARVLRPGRSRNPPQLVGADPGQHVAARSPVQRQPHAGGVPREHLRPGGWRARAAEPGRSARRARARPFARSAGRGVARRPVRGAGQHARTRRLAVRCHRGSREHSESSACTPSSGPMPSTPSRRFARPCQPQAGTRAGGCASIAGSRARGPRPISPRVWSRGTKRLDSPRSSLSSGGNDDQPQQIRGSCSPLGASTILVVPIAVVDVTPSPAATRPTRTAPAASCVERSTARARSA